MIDIEQTQFVRTTEPEGVQIRAKLTWSCIYTVLYELATPQVVADAKRTIKHKIWDYVYGDLADPVIMLETMIRRDMPPSALPHALEKIAELKKLLAYPK